MYTQEITRKHRAAIVLTLDRSASMQQQIRFGRMITTKAEAVTYSANALLTELVDRCRRADGVRDYYDIAVLGYCADRVESLLPTTGFISVKELSQNMPATQSIAFEEELADGSQSLIRFRQHRWIESLAEGRTPMYEALYRAKELIQEWCDNPHNSDSFPPIVINITDGEPTDCREADLRDICSLIKRTSTSDGNALLLNIHICSDQSLDSVIFPTHEEIAQACDKARLLADCSSIMPQAFETAISPLKSVGSIPPYIAMGYNATVLELLSMINIGSRSITQLD